MKLNIQEVNHNHVTRLVIFSAFLYKEMRKHEKAYLDSMKRFLKAKIPYNIELSIDVGPKMAIEDQRDKIIECIFDPSNNDSYLNLVVVSFKTGLKSVNIQINLDNEDKYESYLYS